MSVTETETVWQIVNREKGTGGRDNLQKYSTVTYFFQRGPKSPKMYYRLGTNLVTHEPVGDI